MGEIISKMYLYIFDIEKDVAYDHGYLALEDYAPIDSDARIRRAEVKRRQRCLLHSSTL